MALYWKDSHLLWTGGHLSWGASCCCNFDEKTACCCSNSLKKIRYPHVVSMTISDAAGTSASSKCIDSTVLGAPVPSNNCTGVDGVIAGKTSNRCQIMNGTWEMHDDAACTQKFWEICQPQFSWAFCNKSGCTLSNGSCTLSTGFVGDPTTDEPCYFGRIILTDQCFTPPFVVWGFYDAFYRSPPLTYNMLTGAYNGVGTFTIPLTSASYGGGGSGYTAGNPCTAPTSVTINAS